MQITNNFEIMRVKLISITRKDELCSSIHTYRFVYVCAHPCVYMYTYIQIFVYLKICMYACIDGCDFCLKALTVRLPGLLVFWQL